MNFRNIEELTKSDISFLKDEYNNNGYTNFNEFYNDDYFRKLLIEYINKVYGVNKKDENSNVSIYVIIYLSIIDDLNFMINYELNIDKEKRIVINSIIDSINLNVFKISLLNLIKFIENLIYYCNEYLIDIKSYEPIINELILNLDEKLIKENIDEYSYIKNFKSLFGMNEIYSYRYNILEKITADTYIDPHNFIFIMYIFNEYTRFKIDEFICILIMELSKTIYQNYYFSEIVCDSKIFNILYKRFPSFIDILSEDIYYLIANELENYEKDNLKILVRYIWDIYESFKDFEIIIISILDKFKDNGKEKNIKNDIFTEYMYYKNKYD